MVHPRKTLIYKYVLPERWNDWRRRLGNWLNSAGDTDQFVQLTKSERKSFQAPGKQFRVDITPYCITHRSPDRAAMLVQHDALHNDSLTVCKTSRRRCPEPVEGFELRNQVISKTFGTVPSVSDSTCTLFRVQSSMVRTLTA